MGERTGINWADHTRNYWIGCTRVGPGCGLDHPEAGPGGGCYAERLAHRFGHAEWGDDKPRKYTGNGASVDVHRWNAKARKEGVRRRLFVNSFSDVLDHRAEPAWRDKIIADAWACPSLDFLLLTKRIPNAARMLPAKLPPNIWLGITAVDSKELHRDTAKLMRQQASVHWVSFEPALGSLDYWRDLDMLREYDWIVWGGESGPRCRAIDVDNLEQLCRWRRDGIVPPLWIKQFGEAHAKRHGWRHPHGADIEEWPEWARIQEAPQAA